MKPPCFLFLEGTRPQELYCRIKHHELVWKAARMDHVSPIQPHGRTVTETFTENPGIPDSGGTRGRMPGGTEGDHHVDTAHYT